MNIPDEDGLRIVDVGVFVTFSVSVHDGWLVDRPSLAAGCDRRLITAGTFGRRETIFEMLSELIPCFRAPRATALPSCTPAEGDTPARRHCRHSSANGHLSTGQTPLQTTGLHYQSEIPDPRLRFLHGSAPSSLGVFPGKSRGLMLRCITARVIFDIAVRGGAKTGM